MMTTKFIDKYAANAINLWKRLIELFKPRDPWVKVDNTDLNNLLKECIAKTKIDYHSTEGTSSDEAHYLHKAEEGVREIADAQTAADLAAYERVKKSLEGK